MAQVGTSAPNSLFSAPVAADFSKDEAFPLVLFYAANIRFAQNFRNLLDYTSIEL